MTLQQKYQKKLREIEYLWEQGQMTNEEYKKFTQKTMENYLTEATGGAVRQEEVV